MICPVATSRAANRVVVPLRLKVVGCLFRQPGPDGEDRLGAVERLDLALLIHAQDERVARRVEVEPDDVADLLLQQRVGENLNVSRRHGATR